MPSAPFVVPPLLLVVVLAVSGVAKLRVPDDNASVFDKLKLPAFLTTIKAPTLLPYGELVLALLLLVLPDGWYVVATTAAMVLFGLYLLVVARALTFGYALMCGCFGRLGLGWITRQTLVRNVVLFAIAVVTWVDSWRGEGVLQRMAHLGDQAWWLAGVAVAMLATALVVRESSMPQDKPAEGESEDDYVARPVPYCLLDGPAGPGSVWSYTDSAARLLVFWNPVDDSMAEVAQRLPVWKQQLAPVQVHLVTQSEWSQAVAVRPELADDLLGDPEGYAQHVLGIWRQPGAVLLGTDRLLAGGPVSGLDDIEDLVEAISDELHAAEVSQNAPRGVANGLPTSQ